MSLISSSSFATLLLFATVSASFSSRPRFFLSAGLTISDDFVAGARVPEALAAAFLAGTAFAATLVATVPTSLTCAFLSFLMAATGFSKLLLFHDFVIYQNCSFRPKSLIRVVF